MNEIKEIIAILKSIKKKINNQTDAIQAKYDYPIELKLEIEGALNNLKNGDLEVLEKLNQWFLPTGVFQEIAISNAWQDEFITLAERFDHLYKKLNK